MRRHLVDTYHKINNNFKTKSHLSARKRMCLQYLKWGVTAKVAERDLFVELAKELRIAEMKIGQPRTLLEKKARKLFWKVAKRKKLEPARRASSEHSKKAAAEKTGMFSPDFDRVGHNRRVRAQQITQRKNPNTLTWLLTSPTGEMFIVEQLQDFCKEHNLDHTSVTKSSIYPGKTVKGWKAKKYSADFDEGFG